jgi:hypothetical protein
MALGVGNMLSLFDAITKRLVESWKSEGQSGRRSISACRCGRPVYFHNSLCLGCNASLGFDPEALQVMSMRPAAVPGRWIFDSVEASATEWKRCENFDSPAGCNWMLPASETETLCRSCRLNQTIPTLDDPTHHVLWRKIENAKRRLVSQLLSMKLPVASKVSEDPERGFMFDFLRSPANGPRVLTGHADGLITLNIEEADDSVRERIRNELHEPYRTLLGHFRHEIGHYYWDRLVPGTPWLEKFRELFGDERSDYAAALERNYRQGPPANWADQYISAYASVHPWEDWAETWAHFLHVVDSIDTALRFGLQGEEVEQVYEPFSIHDLYDPNAPDAERMILLVNSWIQLTTVLNELARSMGQQDYYPFVMSRPVLRKMHFIQMIVMQERGNALLPS